MQNYVGQEEEFKILEKANCPTFSSNVRQDRYRIVDFLIHPSHPAELALSPQCFN